MNVNERGSGKIVSKKDHLNFLAAVFCFWFAIYIYAPVFGVYLQSLGFSYSAIGIILGSYGITQIMLRFPLGILSDFLHKSRKKLLFSGFITVFISSIIFIFFDSFYMVLVARLLAGVTAAMWVMATILYAHYFHASQSAKAMGTLQFITVATQLCAMAICGYLVHLFGWHFPFWIGAVASILGAYCAWNIKDVTAEKSVVSTRIITHLNETIRLPQLKMLTFLSLIAHAILFITIFGFSPIAAKALNVQEKSLIWLNLAFFIPHALASLSLVFYEPERRYHKSGLAVCFIVTAFFIMLIPFASSLVSLSLYHIGIGLALGFIFPILLSEVVRISPTHLKMSAMGFFQSFYAIGIFLGPLVAGTVAQSFGLDQVFYLTAILSFSSAFVVIFLYKGAGKIQIKDKQHVDQVNHSLQRIAVKK
ncbi:MFS transporter [Bacillus sp. FJAT-50079]|uniref:MFS transporter n=1 Tax=Bacillus sp. FJAT-50079 TaxID=2833577 RepID=UPI001BC99BAD|nr:MFS transporter [Bacillus sp. FJAT-50079]MBS4208887.1 MFS transporter [Bacillus sp. FJAT-50079]